MTKEKLKQYNDLKVEITKLEKRIDRLKKQSEIVSDVVQNGYKRHAVIRGYDCKRAYKLDLTIQRLEELRDRAEEEYEEIFNWIKNIKNSDIRHIFSCRYIEGMNWVEIQIELGYKHEDKSRKKHDRYLEKN